MIGRILRSGIILMLIMALVAIPAFAASSVSVSLKASDTTVNSGDTFTVTVSATVDSCGSGGIDVSYSSGVFQLVESECVLSGTALSGSDVFAFESNKGISGKAFTLKFKVKDGAELGSSSITVKFKADSKTASKSISIKVACDHSYSNSCDTTCNSCGASRKINHSWNSANVTKEATCTSTGSQTLKCKVCGETKTEKIEKAAHTYDNNCDTDCNVCNSTREITHDYAYACSETEHWKACTVCGDKIEEGAHDVALDQSGNEQGHGHLCSICGLMPDGKPHDYENDCDVNCKTCGYVRTVTHSYSERLSYDAGGHWYACSICGDRLEKNIHTPGEAATETTDQICTDCGFIIETAGNHVHTMAGDWLSDDNGHWFLCICGAYTDSVEHTLDDGVVDEEAGIVTYTCTECGHVKQAIYIPPEQDQTDIFSGEQRIPTLYVLIGLGVAALSLITNVIFIICGAVRRAKRKKEERQAAMVVDN